MNLVDGEIYYSIAPSLESENYEDYKPRTPWPGKLRIGTGSGGKVLHLHRFSEETGEIGDDSNAMAWVGSLDYPRLLFATLEEARAAYLVAALEHIGSCADDLSDYAATVAGYLSKKGEGP